MPPMPINGFGLLLLFVLFVLLVLLFVLLVFSVLLFVLVVVVVVFEVVVLVSVVVVEGECLFTRIIVWSFSIL